MNKITINNVDRLTSITTVCEAIGREGIVKSFPALLAATKRGADRVLGEWKKIAISTEKLYRRKFYVDTIVQEDITSGNTVGYSVYSESDLTEKIEQGIPEHDLKPVILKGQKYKVINFRHKKSVIEKEGVSLRKQSNQIRPSRVVNVQGTNKLRDAISNRGTTTKNYLQGDQGPKLTKQTSKGEYTWQSGKYTRLMKMDVGSGQNKSSTYSTFRTISINSDPKSWIYPEKAAVPIRDQVVEATKDIIQDDLKKSIQQDIAILMQGA